MSPTKAYVQGWLTRAEYIAARMRIAERKLRFQRQAEQAQHADIAEIKSALAKECKAGVKDGITETKP